MDNFLTPLTFPPYIELPISWIEWAGFFVLFCLLGWAVHRNWAKSRRWNRLEWGIFVCLFAFTILASIYAGLRLPVDSALPRTLLPEEPRGPALMLFSAVSWMLAGGLLGPLAGVGLGLISGLMAAFFDSHSVFTLVQTIGLAVLYCFFIRQPYRTLLFRILRHPFAAGAALAAVAAPVIFIFTMLQTSGPLVVRVDYALTRLPASALAATAGLLIGGIVAEAAGWLFPQLWGRVGQPQPSPMETSLQNRFFFGTGPLVILLLITLMAGDWFLAGRAARKMLENQLGNTARMASESIPYFLEAGQNLILHIASDIRVAETPLEQQPAALARSMRSMPYFRQMYIFDTAGNLISSYPETDMGSLVLTAEEQGGIALAARGVSVQYYNGGVIKGEKSALVSFITTLSDELGQVTGVILGRTDLATNPFTKPVIQSLEGMETDSTLGVSGQGSYGMILDENGRILYHPLASRVMTTYFGRTTLEAGFFDDTSPEGTRSLVYYQPATNEPWSIVLSMPAQRVQQISLTIALPLLLMVLFIAIASIVSLRLGLKAVTSSLQTLEVAAGRISRGELDHTLAVKGVDEVGRLSTAFEQMRLSLKGQLDELNRLLQVSQGVATNLDMEGAVQPILDAALSSGASSARIVLLPDTDSSHSLNLSDTYGGGDRSDQFSYLDNQVLKLGQEHDTLVMGNLTRGKGLNFHSSARPGAIIAHVLRHENELLGTLWLGYDKPRPFSDDEIRLLTTLAGEAAMAAANTRLYARAEIGRQRMEAILNSTPDPVFVTDQQNRLLLVNPAAQQISGLTSREAKGKLIDAVIRQKELLDLIRMPVGSPTSHEFHLENGKVFYASISHISLGDQPVGKVCILRDITHFKEMDSIKSDFVATVSHDLRSPLSLMRGYASMLQMVGELNDQQKSYVRKILGGVDGMNHLVTNLLDLGRIDTGVGLQLGKIAVNDILDKVATELQLQAAQKNIQIGRDFTDEDNPIICVDQALLHQALFNLLENAIKYTPVGGQVNLQAEMRREGLVFAIKDSGIGIAPLDQPRLFEKFYRGGQRETSQQRGSGLGLAIVKSIAERHGGRVWVDSSLGKGSTFYLEIPYNQPEGVPA